MSDDDSEAEVPVCGSFEPQVWRKGYCRNCFHPGSKHLTGNILNVDDNKKFGKENIPKKTDRSGKDQQHSTDKSKPLKPTGQESGKSVTDKGQAAKPDKLLDKDKTPVAQSAKEKYAQLQKEKSKPKDTPSPTKTGADKFSDGKKTIPDPKDSSKAIPPPVLPKLKGKGLAADDKLKSKSTSDIREEIKSPIGNKLFKQSIQQDSLDKSKSKFGSAENISLPGKKLDESSKQKSGSAENISVDKSKQPNKLNKDSEKKDSQVSDSSKPDYRSLLSSKGSKGDSAKTVDVKDTNILKKDEASKNKTMQQQTDSKFKLGKETKSFTKDKTIVAKVEEQGSDASKKGFPFTLGTKSKTESTGLKSPLLEKDKPDFKAKFEKPELKSSTKTDEKDKKDFKAKYEKPELKAVKTDDKKKEDDSKLKSKLADGDKHLGSNLSDDIKSKLKKADTKTGKDEEIDKPGLGKGKWKPDTPFEVKDKLNSSKLKEDLKPKDEKINLKPTRTDQKVALPGVKDDLKAKSKVDEKDKGKINTPEKDVKPKFEKPELKSTKSDEKGLISLAKTIEKDKSKQPEDKTKPKFGSVEKDKNKDIKSDDVKSKYEKPALKSIKDDEKGKLNLKKEDDSKVGKTDLKPVLNKDNKFDFKKTLLENKKSKSQIDSEREAVDEKAKLSKPGLKKVDDVPKKDFKAKFDRPQLKSTKSEEPKTDAKSKFEKSDVIHDKKSDKELLNKTSSVLKDNDAKSKDKLKTDNDIKKKAEAEEKTLTKHKESEKISATSAPSQVGTDSLKQKIQVNGETSVTDTKVIKSFPPDSHSQHFDNLSSDAEADFDEPDNACAVVSARSKSPVHVDTLVFTSSRNKTAGVEGGDSDLFTTTPQKGFSGSQLSKSVSPSEEKSADKEFVKNGHISEDVKEKSNEKKIQEEAISLIPDNDVEKLKLALSKMAEKCQLLEKENDSLKHGLSAKESDHSDLERQKSEVESVILGLKEQLKSMEDRCSRLESDNSSLMASLKEQEEVSEHQPSTEETEGIQNGIKESEDICEDLMEENENLKQEIQDLKIEMEEMYDSFRDQEAEEFRELQKELEITAKNCRILQFKMRKAERRNEQLEDDRNLFQDKLRILQNQFENKDAVSHIKTLEQELKVNLTLKLPITTIVVCFVICL